VFKSVSFSGINIGGKMSVDFMEFEFREYHEQDCASHTCMECGHKADWGPFSAVVRHGSGHYYNQHKVIRFPCDCVFGFYKSLICELDINLTDLIEDLRGRDKKKLTDKYMKLRNELIMRNNYYGNEV
jgi:hypothetical protein